MQQFIQLKINTIDKSILLKKIKEVLIDVVILNYI